MDISHRIRVTAPCAGCTTKLDLDREILAIEILRTNNRDWWLHVAEAMKKEVDESLKQKGWYTVHLRQAASGREYPRYFCPSCAKIAKLASVL